MTIAFWCILIAGLLPYVVIGVSKWDKTYLGHNDNPRAWEAKLSGLPARAHAAHLNSFEAFPLFAAGVLVAAYCQAPQPVINAISVAFVLTRVAYVWCYLSDRATLRSVVWMVGLAEVIALFMVAASSK